MPGVIDMIKPKEKDSNMCEVHIKGSEEMILKLFGISEKDNTPRYCD